MSATPAPSDSDNALRPKDRSPRASEGFFRRWSRRFLTISSVFLLTSCLLASLPLLLVLTLICDAVRPRRARIALTRGLLFFVSLLLVESLSIIGVFLLWAWNLVGRDSRRFERSNRQAQTLWSSLLYRVGERLFGLHTHVEGQVPPIHPEDAKVGPLLIFVRHSSTADTVLPVLLLAQRGYRLRYVLKRELLYGPCLDIVGQRLRNHFVARGGKETDQDLRGILDLASDMTSGDALVIYPEGTRFTPQKRTRILDKLRAQGPSDVLTLAESLAHTLPPLQRGPLELLAANQGADLVLMSHAGLEAAGSLTELLAGDLIDRSVFVRFEHIPFAQIPTDPTLQRELLAKKWRQLDDWIAAHKEPLPSR